MSSLIAETLKVFLLLAFPMEALKFPNVPITVSSTIRTTGCQSLSLSGEVARRSRDGEGWFREEPSQQLRQDRVLYDHPGGGQGQGLAVKTGIAVADAVFHKGELPGGKFPPIAGFVLGQG